MDPTEFYRLGVCGELRNALQHFEEALSRNSDYAALTYWRRKVLALCAELDRIHPTPAIEKKGAA